MGKQTFPIHLLMSKIVNRAVNIHHLGLPVRNPFLLLEQAFFPTVNIFDLKVSRQHSRTSKGKHHLTKPQLTFCSICWWIWAQKKNIQNPGGALIRLPSKPLTIRALKPTPFYSSKFGNEFKSLGDPFPRCAGQAPANPARGTRLPPGRMRCCCVLCSLSSFSVCFEALSPQHTSIHSLLLSSSS